MLVVFKNSRLSYLKVNSLIPDDDSRGGDGGGSSGSGGDERLKSMLYA